MKLDIVEGGNGKPLIKNNTYCCFVKAIFGRTVYITIIYIMSYSSSQDSKILNVSPLLSE